MEDVHSGYGMVLLVQARVIKGPIAVRKQERLIIRLKRM